MKIINKFAHHVIILVRPVQALTMQVVCLALIIPQRVEHLVVQNVFAIQV
jgi:hypothetical protein